MHRLFQGIGTVFVIIVIAFILARLSGNPVDVFLGIEGTPEQRQELIQHWGLDRPYPEQFATYLSNVVRGDLGSSYRFSRPNLEVYLERLPITLYLVAVSLALSLVISIPLGVLAAVRKGSWGDTLIGIFAPIGMAAPHFWVGLLLIFFFSVVLGVLPAGRADNPLSIILPAITLGFGQVAGTTRLLRSSMLETLDNEFVKLARAKGAGEMRVILVHVLRNSILSVVSFTGMSLAIMLGGAVVVETVFTWPGVGRLTYIALQSRDYPLIQALFLLQGTLVVVISLVVDIVYAYIDPRIRY